ncbi:hypothetical protein JB92DRAFT_666566 [Gautieria morchelliformis]|nr:hypothetical protein JB92DRAFT_666566 [Gautieria morchelliformis]
MPEFEAIRAARIMASREFLVSVGLDAPHDRPHENEMAGSKRKRDSRSPDPRKVLASSDDEIEVTGYRPAPPMHPRINVNRVPPNVDRVPPNVNRVPPNVNRVPPNVNRVPPWLKKSKNPTARTKPETINISSDEEKYALPRPKSFGTSQSHKPSAVYTSSSHAVGLDIKPKAEGQSVQPPRTSLKRNLSQARIYEKAHLSGGVVTNVYFKPKVGGAAGPSVQPPRKRVKTQKPQNDTKLNPIIVLSSSDDEPKLETPDVGLESDSDSDSDYDNFHGGYNMHWSTVRYLFFLGVCLVILYVM